MSLNPLRILKNEAEEEKAEVARLSSFIGAIAIGDLVKSTLGPKGMDKMLVSWGRNAGQVIIVTVHKLLLVYFQYAIHLHNYVTFCRLRLQMMGLLF